jgi:hypothetical protein
MEAKKTSKGTAKVAMIAFPFLFAIMLLAYFDVERAIGSIQPTPEITPDRIATWSNTIAVVFVALIASMIAVYLFTLKSFYRYMRDTTPTNKGD